MKLTLPLLSLPLVLIACDPSAPIRSETTDSGLVIDVLRDGQGAELETGSYAVAHYRRLGPDGTVLEDSRTRDQPFLFEVDTGFALAGWDEGLRGAREGAIRRLTMPPELAFGRAGFNDAIAPDSSLVYEIEILPGFEQTDSGLRYREIAPGEGEPPKGDEFAVVRYRAWLLSTGREIDSSQARLGSFTFRVSDEQIIPALREAVQRMRPKGRSQLVVRPSLGYGLMGVGSRVPPRTDLIYDVELVGTRPPR